MKRIATVLLLFAAFAGVAAPVSVGQAGRAVENWLRTDAALGCRLGGAVADARTCSPTNGAVFHVVRLAGGGFVVTSADTRIEPVLAFSDSGDLVESDANPLWSLLKGDVAARAKGLSGASFQSVAPGGTVPPTAAESRWAALLKDGPALQDVPSVSDVRVEPLVKSKWGQGKNSYYSNWGDPCYNYYTPDNYVCGCVATALTQLMRFHRYPKSVIARSRTCKVDGVERSFTMRGGSYDYDAMKLVPEAYPGLSWYDGGATEAQRQAIGKLTYDCGVAMQMSWASGGSGAGGAAAHGPLKELFLYKCAHTAANGLSNAAYRDRILRTNLDAGYPVLLGVDGPFGGHEILADGYGFSASVLYTHLNMGWSGSSDAWYALPGIDSSPSFDTVTHAVYNIMPDKAGEIVSGRVVTDAGIPVEGATVTIRRTSGMSRSVSTNARGVYAFVLDSPPRGQTYKYSVCAAYGTTTSSEFSAPVKATEDSTIIPNVGYCSYYPDEAVPTCGNVLCDDLVLANLPVVADPVFMPSGCVFYPETNILVSCVTAGAVIRYTLDGTDPTEGSAEYRGPIRVTADTTVKARAFKNGSSPSAVVTAVYTYGLPVVRTETAATDVPVPYAWLDAKYPGVHTAAQYEALAVSDSDGDGFAAWQEYLCGTDPTAADDLPRCTIAIVGGKPVVGHNVVVPAAAALEGWRAVLQGSDALSGWEDVPDLSRSAKRFFKVVVERR